MNTMEVIVEDDMQEIFEKLSATDLENEIIVTDIGQLEKVFTRVANYLVVKLHTS